LEARDPIHIAKATVRTSFDLKTGVVSVSGELSRAAPAATLQVTLSLGGAAVARVTDHVRSERFQASVTLPQAKAWSPEAPNLYDLVFELIVGDNVVDAIERTVGFRRFEVKDGRLMLNSEPFYMFGALDQDSHPEEECRPPSADFLEQRFANAKAMGLNTLRCPVKIPDPFYFELIYLNSSSAKAVMMLMDKLDAAAAKCASVDVYWYYDKEDDTMQELGEEFGEDLENAKFHLEKMPG
jgi:beta-galactosidase/beta-glucuronidase